MKMGRLRAGKRTILILAGILILIILIYFVVVPTVVANRYFGNLDSSLARAHGELTKVSAGANTAVFEDPDIPLDKRREMISSTLGQVQQTQKALDELGQANALPVLPGNGFAGSYHKASMREERTSNAIRQSKEVLGDYAATLTYIDAYTEAQQYLDQQLQYINGVRDFGTLAGQGNSTAAVAAQLRTNRERLAGLTPPPDFAPLHDEMLQNLDQGTVAFEYLALGLNQQYETTTYSAVSALEQLTLKYDTDRYDLFSHLGEQSVTLRQLYELPEKIEHVQE